jgi:hypothetical protein
MPDNPQLTLHHIDLYAIAGKIEAIKLRIANLPSRQLCQPARADGGQLGVGDDRFPRDGVCPMIDLNAFFGLCGAGYVVFVALTIRHLLAD